MRLHDLLVGADEVAQQVGRHVGVVVGVRQLLGRVERLLELLGWDVEHDAPVHRHEAAIGVVCEALVAGLLGQTLDRLVVETEVENGVHHPGHGELRTRAHAHQQRVGRVAELLAHRLLERLHVLRHLGVETFGPAALHVVAARVGRDGESGGNRQARAPRSSRPGWRPCHRAGPSCPSATCGGCDRSRRRRSRRRSLVIQVEEAERLVAEGNAGGAQGVAPVAPHLGVRLLHAVVGDEEERGVVHRSGALDCGEHLAQARVGVPHGCGGHLGVRPALVERGVGEREVHPHESGPRHVRAAIAPAPDAGRLLDARVVDARRPPVVLQGPHEPLRGVRELVGRRWPVDHLALAQHLEGGPRSERVARLVDRHGQIVGPGATHGRMDRVDLGTEPLHRGRPCGRRVGDHLLTAGPVVPRVVQDLVVTGVGAGEDRGVVGERHRRERRHGAELERGAHRHSRATFGASPASAIP